MSRSSLPFLALLGPLATGLIAAPANDNFAAAAAISAASGSLPAVNTSTASGEPGEPEHAGISGGRSIWHRFTPAAKDRFVFHTVGSNFDTLLAAYTGSAVNTLTEIASNDDFSTGNTSRIECFADPANPVSIAIDGYLSASGNAVLSWANAVLANDAFSSSVALSGAQGAVSGWNFRATSESGELNAGNSVWYRWTAPANANGLITVNSPDMAAFVGVYTGTSVGALTEVATSNAGPGADATASFAAVSGTIYRIQVKGNTGGAGEFSLSWGVSGGSATQLLPDIISVASQADQYMYGWSLDQAELPGRTLLRVTTATANVGAGKLELRGSTVNPAVYQRVFNLNGTYSDRLAGTFTFHPTHGHLHFDGWLQFHLRAVTEGNGVGEIVAAGDKTSFAIIDLDAYNLSLPGASPNSVYSGGLVQGISVGWSDIYNKSLDDQWIDVTNVPPGAYWLESVVDPDNRVLESDETNNATRILVNYAGSAPPNNNFLSGTLLTGATAATNGRNYSATKESNEPAHAGNAGGKSVWYRWTAPSTGSVTISTDGSSFDTLLGVYTGSGVSTLTPVAFNDDDASATTSRVTFNAVIGTAYRIAVDGKDGAAGTIEIAINPAANDHFADAVTLTGVSGTATGSNRGATAESGEPGHHGSTASTSIWYFWNAPLTGDAAFSTEGTTFDARLAVYTGSSVTGLTPVASSAGAGLNAPATVNFHINSGTGYYIAVDGGPGTLRLTWQAATALAPYVITHPVTGNHPQGTNLQIAAAIGGSPTLTYQWEFAGHPVTDGAKYAGANSPVLTVRKIEFSDSGTYRLTGTNPSGTITTNPASIIVIANPRTASIVDSVGDIGGSVFAPVMFNATGSEHALQFTLNFDPAVLSNGRISAGPAAAGALIILNRDQESAGRLGVTLTLPGSEVFPAGLHQAIDAQFDVSPSASPGNTILAFGDAPVVHHARSVSDTILPVVFDPGNVTLEQVTASIAAAPAPDGGATLTVRGLRGKEYQLLQSADMTSWSVAQTAAVGSTGVIVFTLPPGGTRGFFMAAPAP
jgi:hypothetical protein